MKKIILSLSVVILLAMFTMSCSKGNNSPNVEAQLIGTWNLSQIGVDSNANGKIDASESMNTTTLGITDLIIIQKGGTGSAHIIEKNYIDTSFAITWSLINQKELIISGNNAVKEGTIQSITSSTMTMIVHDTSSGQHIDIWDIFNKE